MLTVRVQGHPGQPQYHEVDTGQTVRQLTRRLVHELALSTNADEGWWVEDKDGIKVPPHFLVEDALEHGCAITLRHASTQKSQEVCRLESQLRLVRHVVASSQDARLHSQHLVQCLEASLAAVRECAPHIGACRTHAQDLRVSDAWKYRWFAANPQSMSQQSDYANAVEPAPLPAVAPSLSLLGGGEDEDEGAEDEAEVEVEEGAQREDEGSDGDVEMEAGAEVEHGPGKREDGSALGEEAPDDQATPSTCHATHPRPCSVGHSVAGSLRALGDASALRKELPSESSEGELAGEGARGREGTLPQAQHRQVAATQARDAGGGKGANSQGEANPLPASGPRAVLRANEGDSVSRADALVQSPVGILSPAQSAISIATSPAVPPSPVSSAAPSRSSPAPPSSGREGDGASAGSERGCEAGMGESAQQLHLAVFRQPSQSLGMRLGECVFDDGRRHVEVQEILPGSLAAMAGVRRGDALAGVAGEAVESEADAKRLLQLKTSMVVLLIKRASEPCS